MGLCAAAMTIIQAFVPITSPGVSYSENQNLFHELMGYGGILLHLIVISILIFYNPDKRRNFIILSWAALFLFIIIGMARSLSEKIEDNMPKAFSGIVQRLCVGFLLLSLYYY